MFSNAAAPLQKCFVPDRQATWEKEENVFSQEKKITPSPKTNYPYQEQSIFQRLCSRHGAVIFKTQTKYTAFLEKRRGVRGEEYTEA